MKNNVIPIKTLSRPLVDAKIGEVMERNNDVEMINRKDQARANFQHVKRAPKNLALSGNRRIYFRKGTAILTMELLSAPSLDKVISSHLLLYRTVSLLECGINNDMCDYYKVNWAVLLKHKKTGTVFGLTEWKGTPILWTDHTKDLEKSFTSDLLDLIELLCDPSLTISYDGTIAGSQA